MNEVIEKTYTRAVEVLDKCATPHGFHAAYPGYDAVWARDSNITSLGASLVGERFKKTFAKSLEVAGKYQSAKGQIPNAVDIFSRRKPHVDFQSIDSTLWWIIGLHMYKERYGDGSLLRKYKKGIDKGINWLDCLDMGEDGMPEQQPTSDWFDAFPHRYGHTINTQALYYKALLLEGNKKKAEKVRWAVHKDKDNGLWNGEYYWSWRWKNHNKYKEIGTWFESLANMLAITYELADRNKAEKIFAYVKKKKIARPYPMKALDPPIGRKSKYWYDYFADAESRTPHHYSNGGIWTFIGGFYVCALIKMKKFKEADQELKLLAEANTRRGNFDEWLHGKTGKLGNSHAGSQEGNQAWNAGMYIAAYESVKRKQCVI